jgi:hypothetical protein
MSYTTRTREFGEVTFRAPAATDTYSGYVWIEGEAFPQRQQICYGGNFMGGTVTATDRNLKEVAQKWLRDRRRGQRKWGNF